jgi:hypothetical protein
MKPIRVLFSPLSGRAYATRSYREDARYKAGTVVVTGDKTEVTAEVLSVAAQVLQGFGYSTDADRVRSALRELIQDGGL